MKFLETSQSNGKKTISILSIFSVLSILIIFNFTVISLSAQSERELMDEALKKELGDFSPKRNSETNSEGKKRMPLPLILLPKLNQLRTELLNQILLKHNRNPIR